MKIVTVVHDGEGDLWVRTGQDRWTQPGDLRSMVGIDRWSLTTEELDNSYGPIETLAEIES